MLARTLSTVGLLASVACAGGDSDGETVDGHGDADVPVDTGDNGDFMSVECPVVGGTISCAPDTLCIGGRGCYPRAGNPDGTCGTRPSLKAWSLIAPGP